MSSASIALLSGESCWELGLGFGGVSVGPSSFETAFVVVLLMVGAGVDETADTGLGLVIVRRPVNKDTTQK